MESGGSSFNGKKGKKTCGTGTRRSWNEKEKEILMAELKELVTKGWRSDNGFRPGYLTKLEEQMLQRMPGTNIRANPHINSRISSWKKLHGCLQTALGETGCGFNTTTKVLDVTDEAWAKVLKKDSSIGAMRYKPWPMYEDWLEVFGNERANGKRAEGLTDAVNHLGYEDTQRQNTDNSPGSSNEIPDEGEFCDTDVNSQTPTAEKKNCCTKINEEEGFSYGADE